jgi:hypothetical protein
MLFVIRDGKANEVAVTPGQKVGDLVAVTGDVKAGDKVVLQPPPDLKGGTLVKTASK